jgi:hypothetical protein
MNLPEHKFTPINLWSIPFFEKKCKHEKWMIINSLNYRQCYDCPKKEPLSNKNKTKIEHQR